MRYSASSSARRCGEPSAFHEFSAFGPISDEMAEGIEDHASLGTFEEQLHAWIESGEGIPPPEL